MTEHGSTPTPRPVRIEGKFILRNGQAVEFSIDAEYGWQQWGNTTDVVGSTVDLIEALDNASREFLFRAGECEICGMDAGDAEGLAAHLEWWARQ
jgi:hypothetical protein